MTGDERVTCKVLVVDDEEPIRELVSSILLDDGHRVATAGDGAEALRWLDEGHLPQVILLDMRMPVMDGWEFAQVLAERGVEIPVLVMTAAQNARGWAEEIKAADYLPKPFDLDDITRKVHDLCEAHEV